MLSWHDSFTGIVITDARDFNEKLFNEEWYKRTCQVCGKGEVETKQHFLLHCDAHNHNRKGAKLQNSSWKTSFQEGHVEDTNKQPSRMMCIRGKLLKANADGLGDLC